MDANGSRLDDGPLEYPPLVSGPPAAAVGSGMAPVSSFVRSTLSHAYSTAVHTRSTTTNVPTFSFTIANVLGMAKHATQPAANKNENRLAGVLNMMLGRPLRNPMSDPWGPNCMIKGTNMCRL